MVLGAPVRATVVPVAAAAAFAGKNTQAFGATLSVADHEMVQVVVAAAPIVILPDWLVLPATTAPLVVVPQAPLAIVGKPVVLTSCPLSVVAPAVIGASALSSANRKLSAVLFRLMAGKLEVVPPSWSRLNPVTASFESKIMPSLGDDMAERPVHKMPLAAPAVRAKPLMLPLPSILEVPLGPSQQSVEQVAEVRLIPWVVVVPAIRTLPVESTVPTGKLIPLMFGVTPAFGTTIFGLAKKAASHLFVPAHVESMGVANLAAEKVVVASTPVEFHAWFSAPMT